MMRKKLAMRRESGGKYSKQTACETLQGMFQKVKDSVCCVTGE
jgi:hypothetical protein